MESCNPVKTPLDRNVKLTKNDDETNLKMEKVPYQELIRSLST